MSAIPVSVVIVSRGRPDALTRCLTGVSQLAYGAFEVIVVADPNGLAAVAALPFAAQIKTVAFDEANISQARNLGIAQAAGEVVAFVDDDAVPETGWLFHLIAPFAEDEVAAAGGFVRGRNGISMQWRAQSVDHAGRTLSLGVDTTRPRVLHPVPGRAVKTEGTNMAVRRSVLAEMGGFDPAFHYFLDETDLNWRLAKGSFATAIVPLAEVHHGFLANVQRTGARVPRDLSEIGASMAVFLAKHCPVDEHAAVWKSFRAGQRQRLLRHMVRGDAMPGDVGRLMRGLDKGYLEGQARQSGAMAPIPRAPDGFRPFRCEQAGAVVLSGRAWRRRGLRRQAEGLVAQGKVPSLFLFSPTALYHRVRYDPAGYWEQSGGLFGRSERSQRLFRVTRFSKRLAREIQRVTPQRLLAKEGGSAAE